MSTTRQLLLNTNNPIVAGNNTDLASLASNGVVLCASAGAFSNVKGDAAGQGYPYCRAVLHLGAPGSAWTTGTAWYVWFLTEDDGSNYATAAATSGTSSTPPCSRAPDLIFPVENNTSAQVVTAECAVPDCAAIKTLVWNNAGQTSAASGNALDLYFYTDQLN